MKTPMRRYNRQFAVLSGAALMNPAKCSFSFFPRSTDESKGAFIGNFPHPDAVMSTDTFHNRVPFVTPQQPVQAAARFFQKLDVGCVPVLSDAKEIVGMLSERDIARCVGGLQDPTALLNLTVEDLMSKDVVTCAEGTSLTEALFVMDKNNFRHLPVVSAEDSTRLVGLLSMRDVMHRQLKGDATNVDEFMQWVLKMSS